MSNTITERIRKSVVEGKTNLSRRRKWRGGYSLDVVRLTWARNMCDGWQCDIYKGGRHEGRFSVEDREIKD